LYDSVIETIIDLMFDLQVGRYNSSRFVKQTKSAQVTAGLRTG